MVDVEFESESAELTTDDLQVLLLNTLENAPFRYLTLVQIFEKMHLSLFYMPLRYLITELEYDHVLIPQWVQHGQRRDYVWYYPPRRHS